MKRTTLLLFLSLLAAQMVPAQTACFTYADDGQTIITGISTTGINTVDNDEELTIPAAVQTVKAGAFSAINTYGKTLSTLIVEDGGNPTFECSDDVNALADVRGSLTNLNLGSSMSVDNITSLLEGLGGKGELSRIDIYNADFPLGVSITSEAIDENTTGVKVVLPAARVSDATTIGSAEVYGRFTLTSELVTFCGSALFEDIDFGSHFLFYVPTEVKTISGEKRLYIQRVRYILPNEGVLLHKADDSSTVVVLPRVAEPDGNTQYETDEDLFDKNMLVGVTTATTIGQTEEKADGTYTNMILSKGFFYPTSGGTLGANRAYLQVKQSDVANLARMALFDGNETAGIQYIDNAQCTMDNAQWTIHNAQLRVDNCYDLQGSRMNGAQWGKHLIIVNGKKIIKR